MFRFFRSAYLKRYLRRNAIFRGVLGSQKFWRGVFVLGLAARFAGKVTKRGAGPVEFRESLDPSSGFAIVHVPHQSEKRRRRRRRTA